MSWPELQQPGQGQPPTPAWPPVGGGGPAVGGPAWPVVNAAPGGGAFRPEPRESPTPTDTIDALNATVMTPLPPGQPESVVSDSSQTELPSTVKTPALWLMIAGALVAAGLAMFTIRRDMTFGLIGWVLGGPLSIGAVAMFIVADSKARQNPWYVGSDTLAWGRRVVIGLALIAVGLNAYPIAYHLAQRF